jgi:hypothetical protein
VARAHESEPGLARKRAKGRDRGGPPLASGSDSLEATDSGDPNYAGVTSTCERSLSVGASTRPCPALGPVRHDRAERRSDASAYATTNVATWDSITASGTATSST